MIVFHMDIMLARRKMSLTELSERVGITIANLSILKTGKARAVRLDTLNRLCAALDMDVRRAVLTRRRNDRTGSCSFCRIVLQ